MTTLDPGREVEMIRKHYGEFGGLYDPAQAVAHVRILLAEVDRLNSWAGLMSVLDKHYPPDVIGGNSRDPGVRHVVLVRKLDQLGIELEAAREENQRLHARVDELDGVEQELAEARRITESAERHAYSADKWRADTEADLARVNLELARLRALKHTTNLEMFDEIAALKAERAQIEQAYQHDKVIVQAAERWRAEMPSGPLPDVYADFEIALAAAVDGRAVDALGTDAADGAGTDQMHSRPGVTWCRKPGGNSAHYFGNGMDSPCECGERPAWGLQAASPAGSSTADEGDKAIHSYTSHGWACCDKAPPFEPCILVKCGGPGLCTKCKVWVNQLHAGFPVRGPMEASHG